MFLVELFVRLERSESNCGFSHRNSLAQNSRQDNCVLGLSGWLQLDFLIRELQEKSLESGGLGQERR